MTKLLYFSSLGLMIKVEYVRNANSLRYSSHREMKNDERAMAEQYIMVKLAPKTNYYLSQSSNFVYLGKDVRLKKRLDSFHHKNEMRLLNSKEKAISASVKHLINDSMRNYYTEKIGELIMTARSEMKGGQQRVKLVSLKQQMNDLLNAYNIYTDRKVTLSDIIPSELKAHWPDLEETGCYNVAHSK